MTARALLVVGVGAAALAVALLIGSGRNNAEQRLYRSFAHNANCTTCAALCLGCDSGCGSLRFRLDYARHAGLSRSVSDRLATALMTATRLLDCWTDRPDDRTFFGSLTLDDGTVVRATAKGPGRRRSEAFERAVNVPADQASPSASDFGHRWALLPYEVAGDRNLVLCSGDGAAPSVDDFFDWAVGDKNGRDARSRLETWVAAHLSVELLILKILDGHRYAPRVYGTCGRVYFVEDCGHTLQYHLGTMDLDNRLLVAKELLRLALELTDGTAHPNYSFYLTDLTADNIAVQLDKTTGLFQSLKIIDWSDIIVVANDRGLNSNNNNLTVHVSEHIDCGPRCLTYSKENICQADISDHNVYAVCQEFLSIEGGLLHEITDITNSKNKQKRKTKKLKSLLKTCLWHFNTSRLNTAKLIITEIQQMFK